MSTLLKRILFVVILLGIAYGIYWMIDKKGANNLKEDIVTNTQKTVESLKTTGTPQVDLPLNSGEAFGTPPVDVVVEKNIVVSDPVVKAPVTPTVTPKTTTKTTSTKKTTGGSSNVLFDLFK